MNTVWILVRLFKTPDGEPAWRVVDVVGHAEPGSKVSGLVSDHAGQRSSEGASTHHDALTRSLPIQWRSKRVVSSIRLRQGSMKRCVRGDFAGRFCSHAKADRSVSKG